MVFRKLYRSKKMNKIYRITRPEPGAGFFSNWFWYLGHVIKHKKLNQKCFIDTLAEKNLYNSNFFFLNSQFPQNSHSTGDHLQITRHT